jgi:hypothetical protein
MNLKFNKILITGIIVVSLAFLAGLVLEFWPDKKPGVQKLPESVSKKESLPNNYFFSEEGEEQARQDFLLGELINKLPHEGNNFALSYDFSRDVFVLTLGESENLGNRNFEVFLSENNIEDRSWIENLEVKPSRP